MEGVLHMPEKSHSVDMDVVNESLLLLLRSMILTGGELEQAVL
jgi:hypothetical protein